jgi:hypothetical protein
MKQKEMRFLIPDNLYKRYKILCVEMDLSIPKQTAQLIENFVEVQEEHVKLMKQLKKMKGKE